MKRGLEFMFVSLLLACSEGTGSGPTASDTPWNLVLITLDTVRADALGAYGQPLAITPQLDRIAAEGVLFEQAVASAPHTLASHASLFTGLHPPGHGVRGNHGYTLAPENRTLAEQLQARGYRTRAEIAAPVLRSGTRIAQGFEAEAPAMGAPGSTRATPGSPNAVRSAENISDRGIEFLQAHTGDPFFLWLHYFDAHHPYTPPPAFRARFPGEPYLAEVAALDAEVGRVFEAIRALGLRDRTLVVVTADHGEGLGEHGEPSHTYFVYETTLRVPLLFWGPPSIPQGRRIEPVVAHVDVLPTVLDWLEAPALDDLHGRSLHGLMLGEAVDGRVAYAEALDLYRLFSTTPLRALRDGRWKYIHKVNPELYDLASDPAELENLAAEHPEIVARLEGELRRLLAASPAIESSPAATSPETEAQLEALGYLAPGGAAPTPSDEVSLLALDGLDPNTLVDDLATLSRAKGLIARRRFGEAQAVLRPLAKRHPESGTVLGALASALAGTDNPDALDLFRRARALEGEGCSPLGLAFARALEGAGRFEEQRDVLQAAVEHCPDSGRARNDLAWFLATTADASLRDPERAVGLARSLVVDGEGEPDPNGLDTLAAALAAAGDFAAAAGEQRRAVELLERAGARASEIQGYRERVTRYERAADAP